MRKWLSYIGIISALLLTQNAVLAKNGNNFHSALLRAETSKDILLLARSESRGKKVSVSKASAKSIALSSVRVSGARAVSVELVDSSRPYYKVRLVLPDGKIKNVKVDANSGSVR